MTVSVSLSTLQRRSQTREVNNAAVSIGDLTNSGLISEDEFSC